MRILDGSIYELTDPRFIHLATVREGLRDYMCFRESNAFFGRRLITKPFPPKPQVYIEEIRPIPGAQFTVHTIDEDELWKALAGMLIVEGIIKENDLMEGHKDCVAVYRAYTAKAAQQLKELKEKFDNDTKSI